MDTPVQFKNVPLKQPGRFFIGGSWVGPSASALIDVVAPATEELYLQVASAQEADINRAVAAARRAFDAGTWPRMSPKERAGYVTALADALARRVGDIASIWPNEMGILHSTAKLWAPGAVGLYHYYAGLAATFTFEEEHPTEAGAEVGLLAHEPVGVVGAIIPWNGPAIISAVKVAPALVAGCTLVIKASPEAPGIPLIIAEVAEEVGIPPGVINVVTAHREASEALVRHPDVDKIAFTGSTAAGRRIASILGERIGRCTLELGGKGAAIVLDDYNIELAAAALAQGGCAMTGQICGALSRIIVSQKRHDDMVDALASAFAGVKVGDPFAANTHMGPLATRAQRDRVERYIQSGKADGFRLAFGGGRPRGLDRGFYVEPTLFAGVDNRSTLAQEEIFGPVLAVIPAADEADAIRLANDTIYGLSNAVFTNDADRAYAVARQIRSGTVGHNGMLADFAIGFGGFKQSGLGREGGVEGLRPYLESKTILLQGRPAHIG